MSSVRFRLPGRASAPLPRGGGLVAGSRHRRSAPRLAALGAALLAVVALAVPASPAAAQVELVTRPDGTKVLRNPGGGTAPGKRTTAAPPAWRPAPRAELARAVADHAATHGVDPRLVEAVIQAESAWNGRAVSRAGAMGLMQLMPATAVMLAVDDPWNEAENVRGGTAYLAQMLDRFGDLELALAAYNAGPSAVERFGGIPPYAETREYVRRVLSLYKGRQVKASELEPFLGDRRGVRTRGASVGRSGGSAEGPSPRFARGADGRLVLTNQGVPQRVAPTGTGRTAVRSAEARVPSAPASSSEPAPAAGG